MKVGITQRIDIVKGYKEQRDSLDQRMIEWVVKAGFDPVLIPNSLVDISKPFKKQNILDKWIKSIELEGIIISGGNDIGEAPKRDLTEKFLLHMSKKIKMPVLGICRGMQIMAIYEGADLKKVKGHVGTRHSLEVEEVEEDKFPATVNSYHNYGLVGCPESFKVLAKAEDMEVEAISHNKLPWEGWMWHPEREDNFSIKEINRLRSLFQNEQK